MPKTLQTQVLIGVIVLILVIGALSLPSIVNFFAPAVPTVEQGPTRLDEPLAGPAGKKENEKAVARRPLEDAENPRLSRAPSVITPLPRSTTPASSAKPAPFPAPTSWLQMEEHDPVLEEGLLFPSLAEHYAEEQYLQEVEAMEEVLQQDFDPTAVPRELTAEEVAAIEAEIQESILQEEALQPMQDFQPEEYGDESMLLER